MRGLYALTIPALLLVANASEGGRERALMDEIESSVRLPTGAHPIADYGRYYAFDGMDKVRAVYLVPLVLPRSLRARGSRQDWVNDLPADKRRWEGRADRLPHVFDGGCMMVTIEYDIATKRFLRVDCDGNA